MMKSITLILTLSFLLSGLQAGVIRESKSTVGFAGIGKLNQKTITKLSGLKLLERTISDFDSDNMLLGIAANFFTDDKNKSKLTDLNAMKIYSINHEEKEYSETPIRRLTEEDKQAVQDAADGNMSQRDEDIDQPGEAPPEEESNIKLIRREFKVTDTGDKENINGYDCKKYTLYYVSEWEDTETGERTTDSLFTVVWTTTQSAEFEKANQEEKQFGKAYMKAIGLDMDIEDVSDDILGVNWLSMFGQMGRGSVEAPDAESAAIAKEMQKIKGYPVVIDGSYFVIAPKEEQEEEEEEETTVDVTDVGGLFGAIAKKAIESETKKPKEEKIEPVLSYRTELIRYETADIPESELSVPAGYTKVAEE